jgi:hypothetical protein
MDDDNMAFACCPEHCDKMTINGCIPHFVIGIKSVVLGSE